jgi:hypothetical protein
MNVDRWIEGLINGDILSEREVKLLCIKVTEIFSEVIFINLGIKRVTDNYTGYSLWRHPRPVLRSIRTFPGRRADSRSKIYFYR